jgi:hypothetical protein
MEDNDDGTFTTTLFLGNGHEELTVVNEGSIIEIFAAIFSNPEIMAYAEEMGSNGVIIPNTIEEV